MLEDCIRFHMQLAYGSRRSTTSSEQEKRSVAPAALTQGAMAATAAAAMRDFQYMRGLIL